MDFSLAFILGFLGSLHCAAMCGPLMLALPLSPGGPARFVVGRLIYQLGRIVTYCLIGLLGGVIGQSILLAGFQRWLSIALGVAVLAGFVFSKQVALSAPVIRMVTRLKQAMATQLRQRSLRSLALLGLLNGLLPCGLVYVAAAGAVSRGSLRDGMIYMLLFGLGTLPMMLGLSLSGKLFPAALRGKLNRAIPIGVCLLALLLILRGMALGIPYVSPDLTSPLCCGH